MEDMGLSRDLYAHIVTSGESTHTDLASNNHNYGRDCWFIGKYVVEEIVKGLDGMHLHNGPENASFILNAIPGTSPPEVAEFKANLQIALDKDLPMICANPDLVVHVGNTLYECAGTFAAMYEDMGGRVIYHGKPHAPVYERCNELLGKPDKKEICAIGDSLHTDIAGANNFGVNSVLNLDGIHREELDADTLLKLKDQPHKPTYAMHGFVW
jgi:HAD superfamily hydrolase (TIGR01459 family)